MGVQLVATLHRFSGHSLDTKPTGDVPVGSIFTATDTGEEWVWDGFFWNRPDAKLAEIAGLLQQILDVNREIKTGIDVLTDSLS